MEVQPVDLALPGSARPEVKSCCSARWPPRQGRSPAGVEDGRGRGWPAERGRHRGKGKAKRRGSVLCCFPSPPLPSQEQGDPQQEQPG